MSTFLHHLSLAAPHFILVLIGYLLAASGKWPRTVSDALTTFVFSVAVPALLFGLMDDPSRLPPFDGRLLLAFFGGCLITFMIGRLVAAWLFRFDGVSQSVFALGGVFSNNVLLGIPLAKATLGDAAMPSIGLVLVFNSLILWTLATVSVEWARHGEVSVRGFMRTAVKVVTTPVVAAVLLGAAFGATGLHMPAMIDQPLHLIAQAAVPLALIVVGMGLSEYGVRSGWQAGLGITLLKLLVQPLVVLGLAVLLGLPPIEKQAVVLLASLAVGVNVYLMSRQFNAMQSSVASSMVLSTILSAITVPLALSLAA
ncbi:MAG: AEC family transporter [Betaproteobacteria bacterium]